VTNIIRAATFLLGGCCWLGAGLICLVVLWTYASGGAGLQVIPLFSSGSILIGLVHVVGFTSGAIICFAFGIGLCASALVLRTRN